MTLEGWIFMVGLRVFDLGALIVWLVWFFRVRSDDADDGADGDDWRREDDAPKAPEPPAGGGGIDLPRPDAVQPARRRRDHTGDRPPAGAPSPRRMPAPARRRIRIRVPS